MKKLLTIMLLLAAGNCHAVDYQELAAKFTTPPHSAKPWVYWFWSDGNLTREGITADLEAMNTAGIGGVLIMEVDQGPPKGPVRFMSPQWREMFQFMLAEAKRLNIEVNMNNDAGWCGSGGPWNKPDMSMQQVVWTETFVEGPQKADLALVRPERVMDYYEDIAVLAFPSPQGDGLHVADAAPEISSNLPKGFIGDRLVDRDPATAVDCGAPPVKKSWFIQLEFPQPHPVSHLLLDIGPSKKLGYAGQLQASDDGAAWRTLATFNQASGGLANFPKAEARFYRISFSSIVRGRMQLREINLNTGHRIVNFRGKSGMGYASMDTDIKAVPTGFAIAPEKVMDLTGKFADGRLAWDVPAGRWTVLRIGHTSTGKKNHPAPVEGLGLECDKLSKAAVENHFNGMIGKLIGDGGPSVTEVMTHLHIDSWEVGFQNWTREMRAEFNHRRSYDLMKHLPVMTGRIVGSAEESERFLWDLRRTISEMINDCYADGMRRLAASHSMKLSIQPYAGVGGPFDSIAYAGRSDLPVAEFWNGKAGNRWLKGTSSAGHVYGKRMIGAEAFTAFPEHGKHQNHPGSMKPLGDYAFAHGINRFIIHRYSMQPWVSPPRMPGMTMGPWGTEYERTATWWQQSPAWHDYLSRCQYLLQQGNFVADLLFLRSEEGFNTMHASDEMEWELPEGHDYDVCNAEILLHHARVQDGRLLLESGMSYRLLVLPRVNAMTPELMSRISELVAAGATVVGSPPRMSPSLAGFPGCDQMVARLVRELWGNCDGKTITENKHGAGRMIDGPPLKEVLSGMNISPDLEYLTTHPEPCFNWIHRSTEGAEIYFVANGLEQPVTALFSFRADGLRPEVWHPETGKIEAAEVYDVDDGLVRVPLRFDATESMFLVFRKGNSAANDRVTRVAVDGQAVLDTTWNRGSPAGMPADAPEVKLDADGSLLVLPAKGGELSMRRADGSELKGKLAVPLTLPVDGPWTIEFPSDLGAPPSITMQKLACLSKHPEPGVRYFSGTAGYTTTFEIPPSAIRGAQTRVDLDLGELHVSARVKLNGKDLGIVWKKPYRIEITGAAKPGSNTLEVAVANLWINRLIGDEQLVDDCIWKKDWRRLGMTLDGYPQWLHEGKPSPTGRITFKTWKHYDKQAPLVPSGLLGPVLVEVREWMKTAR